MKKFKSFLTKNFYSILLAVVVGILSWVNYVPGTWLSGWDTLHPEFNFGLYFKRIFWGVWQEHQGLGAVATQAHAAEIPRVILLWVMSWFLPDYLLRYGFFFLTLLAGVLGNYYFLKYVFRKSKSREKIAFLGGLFYLLNLTVVQQYFVPLEMFALHFGSLPWLGLFALKYVDEGKRGDLKWFGVVSLMATGIAHTATLYYVYFGLLGLWLGGYGVLESVLGKGGSQNRLRNTHPPKADEVTNLILGRVLKILGVGLMINAFWLLPNLYFVKNHSREVMKSYIHRNFTPEAFLQGEQYGTLKNLVLQKNF